MWSVTKSRYFPRTFDVQYDKMYYVRYSLFHYGLLLQVDYIYSVSTPPPIQKNDPVGVIVLERVHVDRVYNETRPYSFVLQFENDDSRTYFLSAHSEVELESWIITIKMSRCVEERKFKERLFAVLHITAGNIIIRTCTHYTHVILIYITVGISVCVHVTVLYTKCNMNF